ncbi:uncharacterized protein [Elaeis guineensis]|uniref:uncharacterized protein isoform X1 n=1 Tax=Elaeis guineensis var. tenera TaxID=51953 RepID=UPI003C6DA84A
MEKMERDEWFEKSYCLCCQVSSSGNTVAHVIGLEVVFLGLLWFLFLLAIDLLPLDMSLESYSYHSKICAGHEKNKRRSDWCEGPKIKKRKYKADFFSALAAMT